MIIGIGDEINEWFMALLIGLYWINGSLSFANFLLAGEFHAYVREASCPVDPYASVVLDRPWILFATQSMELGWSPCLPHVFLPTPFKKLLLVPQVIGLYTLTCFEWMIDVKSR
jgi:hypothetical protein